MRKERYQKSDSTVRNSICSLKTRNIYDISRGLSI